MCTLIIDHPGARPERQHRFGAAMPVQKYEDTESGAVDAQFSAIVKEAEDLAAAATVRLKELELELLSVQAEKVHHT